MNNHGNRLSENGLGEESVAVARAAVTIRRALAAAEPEAYLPDLAVSLGGLGRRYADVGHPEVIEDGPGHAPDRGGVIPPPCHRSLWPLPA